MNLFLQVLLDGIALGCAYALVALGYGLIFNITGNFHYVHGGVLVASTMMFYGLTAFFNVPFLLAVFIAIIFAFALGIFVNIFFYEPMLRKGAPILSLFIASFGLYILIENSLTIVFGTRAVGLEGSATILPRRAYDLGPIYITPNQIIIIVTATVLLVVLYFFFTRTRVGTAVRAVASDADVAEVVGIEVKRVRHLLFGIGSGLAAVAGILIALDLNAVDPFMGPRILFVGVASVIIGGFGNVPAAAVGGFAVGVIQNLGAWQFSGEWQLTILFAVLLLVLIVRPEGFFGKKLSRYRE